MAYEEDSLPLPDPTLEESKTPWTTLHSLSSLRLTLRSVLRHCTVPGEVPLVEFPLKTDVDCPLKKLESPLRTEPPRARLNVGQLLVKILQLKSAVKLYRERLCQLQQGSREIFGEIWGERVCLLVDTSSQCSSPENQGEEEDGQLGCGTREREGGEGEEIEKFRHHLKQLFDEQLLHKSRVYLLKLESDGSPTPLNLRRHRERCTMVAGEWVEGLRNEGKCSLLSGLEKALALTDIDTILVAIRNKPQEEKNVLLDFLKERKIKTHLHWVTYCCDSNTQDIVAQLASVTVAHCHSFSEASSGDVRQSEVIDTDIDTITAELNQAEEEISQLELLHSGTISDDVHHILMQLAMASCKFEADTSSTEDCHISTTTQEWLASNSLEVLGLSIYDTLAPNAYRQVKTTVDHTESMIPSVVYDETMLQITWHDGSMKYLHVDVHQLEEYKAKVERYIVRLRERLNWLVSGSRAPFGVITEKSVWMVVEISATTLPFVSHLQSNLNLLLTDQLSHTQDFNITRIGDDTCSWRPGLTETTAQSLKDAWVWLLSQSPSGSAPRLLPALETIFNQTRNKKESVGVYLILSSLTRESTETICSFLHENTQRNLHLNVVLCRHSPPSVSHAVAGIRFEEGFYANEQELTHNLREITTAGNGRFHNFKGPDAVDSDDIEQLLRELEKAQDHLQMAGDILRDYRSFCRRFVPSPAASPPPPPSPSLPLPLYPRPNTSFLSRLNAAHRRIPRSVSDSHLSERRPKKSLGYNRRFKTHSYPDTKRWASIGAPQQKTQRKTESNGSISVWLSRYGLKSLGLNFGQFEVRNTHTRPNWKNTYKHIDNRGRVVELKTDHNGLKTFAQQLRKARDNYTQKLTELGQGWKNVFGWISESKVLLLVDMSSSMAGSFRDLQTALTDLIQHRPHSLKYLNMVAYSSSVRRWREALSALNDDDTTSSAVQWVAELKPGGCSCLLHALKVSLESGAKIIYLVTDGTADHTHDFLLSQLPQLRALYGQQWMVHTVAYHCTLESSYSFLKELAHRTGGRYHSYPWGSPADSHERLLQNRFLGDDLIKLVREISSAEDQLHEVSCYL